MISVIIPIYNVEQYLEKCIRSVLNNTYKDLEVICVNDGSPDRCCEILQDLAKEDSRVIAINQDNQGVQMARNNGLQRSNGEYIAFVDSDDWVHPQYFESLLACMESTGADIVVCGARKFDDGDDICPDQHPHIQYNRLKAESFFKSYYTRHMCWGRLYRRLDVINTHFVPEIRMGDDTVFNLMVISDMKNPIVYETDTPLYYYLQRRNSIVKTANYEKLFDVPSWTAENYRCDEQNAWSWMLLMHAIKIILSYRYETILHKDDANTHRANQVLEVLVREMKKNHQISMKEKMSHMIMKWSPQIYRYFRIKDDPTMKEWERIVRNARI